ncbi:UNVERIFIED_CONTAM: hypothetical protein FKN15_052485 [Acipenser sinensis]
MEELREEVLLEYISAAGGRVKNSDLLKDFKHFINHSDKKLRAKHRDDFKQIIDKIALVKTNNGEKFLSLKKKYKQQQLLPEREREPGSDGERVSVPRQGGTVMWEGGEVSTGLGTQVQPSLEPSTPTEATQDLKTNSPDRTDKGKSATQNRAVCSWAGGPAITVTVCSDPPTQDLNPSVVWEEPSPQEGPHEQGQPESPRQTARGWASSPQIEDPLAQSPKEDEPDAVSKLDPLEKEWIHSAACGRLPVLNHLLQQDPTLVYKKVAQIKTVVMTVNKRSGKKDELDPLEKEWIHSAACGRLPVLNHLLQQDPTLVYKKVAQIKTVVMTVNKRSGKKDEVIAVAAEDPGRAGKAAARESTGALKAWLSEHLKNPYPTKGEKVMLAIVTKMSLTQVSTWFANARRRLKKENKVSWVCKNKSDEESESEEEEAGEKSERAEEEEEEDIDLQTVDDNEEEGSGSDGSDQESTRTPDRLSPAAPGDGLKESERETENKGVPRLGDDTKPQLGAKENTQPQKHQIWSLVETATSGTGHSAVQKRRVHHIKSQDTGGLRADLAVRKGQYFPVYLPAHYTQRQTLPGGMNC